MGKKDTPIISTLTRSYAVVLTPHPDSDMVLVTVKTKLTMMNNSLKPAPLFRDFVVNKGFTDDKGYRFRDFLINDTQPNYEARIQQCRGKSERIISCAIMAQPGEKYDVSFTEEFPCKKKDFVRRIIVSPSRELEVVVKHPRYLKSSLKWFIPRVLEKRIKRKSLKSSATFRNYSESLRASVATGWGFELDWDSSIRVPWKRILDLVMTIAPWLSNLLKRIWPLGYNFCLSL
jgi:hypothetical protein